MLNNSWSIEVFSQFIGRNAYTPLEIVSDIPSTVINGTVVYNNVNSKIKTSRIGTESVSHFLPPLELTILIAFHVRIWHRIAEKVKLFWVLQPSTSYLWEQVALDHLLIFNLIVSFYLQSEYVKHLIFQRLVIVKRWFKHILKPFFVLKSARLLNFCILYSSQISFRLSVSNFLVRSDTIEERLKTKLNHLKIGVQDYKTKSSSRFRNRWRMFFIRFSPHVQSVQTERFWLWLGHPVYNNTQTNSCSWAERKGFPTKRLGFNPRKNAGKEECWKRNVLLIARWKCKFSRTHEGY